MVSFMQFPFFDMNLGIYHLHWNWNRLKYSDFLQKYLFEWYIFMKLFHLNKLINELKLIWFKQFVGFTYT